MSELAKIKESVKYIQDKFGANFAPKAGIVLGSGLGGLVKELDIEVSLPYGEIPNFPVSTVEGHAGNLLKAKLGGKDVIVMQGRFHYYEGYTMNQVVLPIRCMKFFNIDFLVLSNASGGVNPNFEVGDIMIQNDHLNLIGDNPLMGPNIDELGPRFPDMMEVYDKGLIEKAKAIAARNNIKVHTGCYSALSGPCLETPAEYAYIYRIGADTVGMSTIPEAIAAHHMGIKNFAMSVITDLGVPGKIVEMSHEQVQEAAAKTEPKMSLIVKTLVAES
jgi:purine-nucleoside phosphorylase